MSQKETNTITDGTLTHDDMDMLQQVLENVRGAYPDSPYRQADYLDEELDLEPEA